MNEKLQQIKDVMSKAPVGVASFKELDIATGDVFIQVGGKILALTSNKSYAAALVLLYNNAMSLVARARKSEQLEAENEKLKQALDFYANEINYWPEFDDTHSVIDNDGGMTAREVLEATSADKEEL